MAQTTVGDVLDYKGRSFEDRAQLFTEEIKKLADKYGVAPWAALHHEADSIMAIPMLRDLWQKDEPAQKS